MAIYQYSANADRTRPILSKGLSLLTECWPNSTNLGRISPHVGQCLLKPTNFRNVQFTYFLFPYRPPRGRRHHTLWCFADVISWFRVSCSRIAGSAAQGSARYLRVELDPAAWTPQRLLAASKLVVSLPSRPVTAAKSSYSKVTEQLLATHPEKLPRAILAISEVVQKLPTRCPTVVEQLPRELRIGPISTRLGRSGPHSGRRRQSNRQTSTNFDRVVPNSGQRVPMFCPNRTSVVNLCRIEGWPNAVQLWPILSS